MTRDAHDGGPTPKTQSRTATRVDTAVSLETIGPLLTRLRVGQGLSQPQVAEQLCGLSGNPTVSRHEVSRWERQERIPGLRWLPWLAAVLNVALADLEAAVARARPTTDPAAIPAITRAVKQPSRAMALMRARARMAVSTRSVRPCRRSWSIIGDLPSCSISNARSLASASACRWLRRVGLLTFAS
jgi:transcriptional regulator with XRE-family HTH domain